MSAYLYLLIGAMGLLLSMPATAKDAPNYMADKIEVVEEFSRLARENIGRAIAEDGQAIPQETPEESPQPIIPDSENLRIVNRGVLTGMANYCGLDWQEMSFRPFMAAERARQIWTEPQMAYIGLLHGISQGYTTSELEKSGPCDDARRKQTQDALNTSQP